ncbi:uncharacterized protein EV154DRAFT_581112, partial [Mucor mucedo]|uniref:uncharacterized protein n=1 Tax=Mucor mucedo TaxID=29922 RepID=UPI00222110AF
TLPNLLRSIRIPSSSRLFDEVPKRLYNGLWLNSLLYADDVVILGTFETMPRLLKMAEQHSFELGYRWNPLKSVIVNSPKYIGSSPLKLYGSPIPCADHFSYLGIPFNSNAEIDVTMLIERNTRSAIVAMRTGIQPLGVHSPCFSRLTTAKLYTTFIRSKMEYGLNIALLLIKHNKLMEKAQDQCLRLAFGGHKAASTTVFKHLTNLPHMGERIDMIRLKSNVRISMLPTSTLIGSLLPHLTTAPISIRFQWPRLLNTCKIWPTINTPPKYTSYQHWIEVNDKKLAPAILKFRQQQLNISLTTTTGNILLKACRPYIGVDPILQLPMTTFERSRLLRWRMGWLPARRVPCSRCDHHHASRNHLVDCLRVAEKFNIAPTSSPNPLDYIINQLPKWSSLSPSIKRQQTHTYHRWLFWWPILSDIMLEIDQICQPDSVFSLEASDCTGNTTLNWLLPYHRQQQNSIAIPPLKSTLYWYMDESS